MCAELHRHVRSVKSVTLPVRISVRLMGSRFGADFLAGFGGRLLSEQELNFRWDYATPVSNIPWSWAGER